MGDVPPEMHGTILVSVIKGHDKHVGGIRFVGDIQITFAPLSIAIFPDAAPQELPPLAAHEASEHLFPSYRLLFL